MRRLLPVALIVVGIALPACAQRGSSRGGVSSHGSLSGHGGFRASAPSRSPDSPRFTGSRSLNLARAPQRGFGGNTGARPPYTGERRYRRPYVSPYRVGIGYGYLGWVNPYFLSYLDDSGYDDSSTSPAYASEADNGPPADQGQPEPPGPYQPAFELPRPSPALGSQEAVTLVFKDGRPPEQIHNYLLTRATLYVQDQQHRDIPIDQLDLVATARVNQDAGVDFHLPEVPK